MCVIAEPALQVSYQFNHNGDKRVCQPPKERLAEKLKLPNATPTGAFKLCCKAFETLAVQRLRCMLSVKAATRSSLPVFAGKSFSRPEEHSSHVSVDFNEFVYIFR